MSTQTPNLNLDLREASDIFNPLSTNSNFETLDSVIDNIQKKGGVPTYTTTASANLLKLSENPTPNETVFKFVAAGDANTWSYQETVNNIVSLDGAQKTVKAGEMYVAWVNAANAMVVIAWPDVVNAQTFDGKGPAEWATTAQLQAVNQTAQNATTTAQAAATVANNALEVAQAAGFKVTWVWENPNPNVETFAPQTVEFTNSIPTNNYNYIIIEYERAYNDSYLFPTFIRRNFNHVGITNIPSSIYSYGPPSIWHFRNARLISDNNNTNFTGVEFYAAYYISGSATPSNPSNQYMMPMRIGYC